MKKFALLVLVMLQTSVVFANGSFVLPTVGTATIGGIGGGGGGTGTNDDDDDIMAFGGIGGGGGGTGTNDDDDDIMALGGIGGGGGGTGTNDDDDDIVALGGIGGGGGGTGTNDDDDEMTKLGASALLFNAINEENVITFFEHDYAAKVTQLKAINLEKLDSRKLELLIKSYQQNKWVPTLNQ